MPFLNRSTLTYPATNVFPGGIWEDTRDPTTADFRNFFVGTMWVNFSNQTVWFMVDRTATSGTWVKGAASGLGILTATGDAGGAVGPDGANNINLLTGPGLTTTGNPGTNTITWTLDGAIAQNYVEDVGNAVPVGGVLNVVGGLGIATLGAGNTITISNTGIVALQFTEDAGVAVPAAFNLNIFGGTGISTSGVGDTVTVSLAADVATQYTCDVGVAVPAANNLNVFGSGGTNTSGAGSTITINSNGVLWTDIAVVGPTSMAVNHGYTTSNAVSRVQLTLPLTAKYGTIIRVVGRAAGLWQINQNAGQNIVLEGSSTSVGVLGTLQSSASTDSVELLCTVADTTWQIISGVGNYIFN